MRLSKEEAALRAALIQKLKPPKNKKRRPVKKIRCNKRQFSKREAESILNHIKDNGLQGQRRKECRIYHCPICNSHHLTKIK